MLTSNELLPQDRSDPSWSIERTDKGRDLDMYLPCRLYPALKYDLRFQLKKSSRARCWITGFATWSREVYSPSAITSLQLDQVRTLSKLSVGQGPDHRVLCRMFLAKGFWTLSHSRIGLQGLRAVRSSSHLGFGYSRNAAHISHNAQRSRVQRIFADEACT